jgi:hypothetical protein
LCSHGSQVNSASVSRARNMAANSSLDILAVSGFSRWGSLVKAAAHNNL